MAIIFTIASIVTTISEIRKSLSANYDILKHLHYTFKIHNYTAVVQVGAENLTNAYYSTYADWGNIPRMGRNIFTSLKINF